MRGFAVALLSVGSLALCANPIPLHAQQNDDAKIQQDVQKALKGSRFKDVQAVVQNGVVKLSGTVPVFQDKEDADKKAHHVKSTDAVENEIQVAPVDISDADLQEKLAKALSYDRVGYGNTFNAITVSVQNGVATLSGNATWARLQLRLLCRLQATRRVFGTWSMTSRSIRFRRWITRRGSR